MNLRENLKKLGQGFLDLVFPISCLVCGKDGSYLCTNCKANLKRLEEQQCLVCQKAAPFGKTHPDCVSRNSVDGIISALDYKDRRVKKIIETLKYNFVSALAAPLSDLILEQIRKQNLGDYFADFILVPVPLHRKRFNWRGFNQASLLAEKLKEKLGCELADTVTRIKNTKPQIKLTQEERRNNIANAFSTGENLQGKKFLIVDDVVTTGATINEIAKLLKQKKAAEVWALTAARG
ncbi:MAG: ComF family protein [Candidatus Doudnabacteria bacterium]|nr:ComF family protein [Candidatus Doudnabacteria bacterium]